MDGGRAGHPSAHPGTRLSRTANRRISSFPSEHQHGGQKEGCPLVWEDGRRIVFQTVIVMFEIERALELGGST